MEKVKFDTREGEAKGLLIGVFGYNEDCLAFAILRKGRIFQVDEEDILEIGGRKITHRRS